MVIKLLVFGQISDLIGKTELEFSNAKNTEELKVELVKKYPEIKGIPFAIAVNKKLIKDNTTFVGNETVALLPAFSGG